MTMTISSFCAAALILTALPARAELDYGGSDVPAECGLYLAETVDDNGALTMGVFSAIDRPAGNLVGFPDVVLPLVDIPLHNSPTHEESEEYWHVWNDLVWDATDAGGLNEGADVKSASLGLGSVTRGNEQKANVLLLQSHYDDSGLHRGDDPAAGSISYYHGSSVVSTADIAAGEELFFPHGYHWYLTPQDQEQRLLDSLPLDNPKVKDFWHRYEELNQKHGEALTSELRTKLWTILEDSPLDSSVRRVLPASWVDASTVAEHVKSGGNRSPEWLREHGLCMDNIVQGTSTMRHPKAGRGAFMTRPVPKNGLIAPAPLVHILDKKALDMFTPKVDEGYKFLVSDEVSSQQLLLNYCFGHKESTKLMCPIGSNTAFINHSPTPNAGIRWSQHQSHQKEWLNMTVEELGDKLDIGLVLEFYALRDLQEGEEVFINYGEEWEDAWNEHLADWEPPEDSDEYVSAEDMNHMDIDTIKTEKEQEEDPYPQSVVVSCFYEHADDGTQVEDDSGEYSDPREQTAWVKEFNGLDMRVPDYMFIRPCRVLDRVGADDYTVQILNFDHQHSQQQIPDTHVLIVKHMPRDTLTFTDFAYSTDMHMEGAFRHEMMFPDTMFPKAWRNLRA